MKSVEKKMPPLAWLVFAVVWMAVPSSAINLNQDSLTVDEVIARVECKGWPGHDYALYIPKKSLALEDPPVLFVLDPAARGEFALRRFQAAASRWGVIVAASNSSRNGPVGDVVSAIRAMWQDFKKRMGLEPKVIYAAGFSGGARASAYFSRAIGRPVTGIIACGAGLSPLIKVSGLETSFYCGIAGYDDFNYREMRRLDASLDKVALPHHFIHGPFDHRWPEIRTCERALGWLIFRSAKARLLYLPEFSAREFLENEITELENARRRGDTLRVAREASTLLSPAEESRQYPQISKLLKTTLKSKMYRSMARKEARLARREERLLSEAGRVFNRLEKGDADAADLPGITLRLGISGLRRQALHTYKDRMVAAMARRVLNSIGVEASHRGIQHQVGKKRLKLAMRYYDIVTACGKPIHLQALTLYNSACIYALWGRYKAAMQRLDRAIIAGFRNLTHLKQDPDLAGLRSQPEFSSAMKQWQKLLDEES